MLERWSKEFLFCLNVFRCTRFYVRTLYSSTAHFNVHTAWRASITSHALTATHWKTSSFSFRPYFYMPNRESTHDAGMPRCDESLIFNWIIGKKTAVCMCVCLRAACRESCMACMPKKRWKADQTNANATAFGRDVRANDEREHYLDVSIGCRKRKSFETKWIYLYKQAVSTTPAPRASSPLCECVLVSQDLMWFE